MPEPVSVHDFPEIRWRGHWIWVPEESIEVSGWVPTGTREPAPESHGLVRRTFHLERVPHRAPARLTADSRYALFVNGREVCRGPIRSQPRRLMYDLVDLAAYLREGQNAIAIYVKYYGQPTSHWMPAAANVRLGKTGILAIVSGLAPQARWARIVERITDASRLVVRSWTGGNEGEYSEQKIHNQLRGVYTIDWDTEREVVLAEPFMSYVVHDAVAQAGKADLLPDLYPRWSEFLVDGYDTIGECWGWGTHAHGWSCTPTRDMLFYTLGITPAEPGYAAVRVAPRLGRLSFARGSVPSPHGVVTVEASRAHLTIDSPVPVVLDLPDQPERSLAAGHHELTSEMLTNVDARLSVAPAR